MWWKRSTVCANTDVTLLNLLNLIHQSTWPFVSHTYFINLLYSGDECMKSPFATEIIERALYLFFSFRDVKLFHLSLSLSWHHALTRYTYLFRVMFCSHWRWSIVQSDKIHSQWECTVMCCRNQCNSIVGGATWCISARPLFFSHREILKVP